MKLKVIYCCLLALILGGCMTKSEPAKMIKDNQLTTQTAQPKYWLWLTYNEETDFHQVCQKMADTGIDGLLLSAPVDGYKKVIPIAEQYQIKVHAWGWIMNCVDAKVVADHPEWLSVNRHGKNLAEERAYVDHYKFLCPTLPEVQNYLKSKFAEICEIPGLQGVSLDYCRYVDVILPKGLWAHYQIVQDREYAQWDYGYHPHTIAKFKKQYGYDPRTLEDPAKDAKWLQFRCNQITEIALMLREVAHQHHLPISASPFPTPTIAKKMVRQDWGKWQLDFAFPMIYQKFYLEGKDWVIDCLKEDTALGMPIYCGLHAPDFQGEGAMNITEMMTAALQHRAKGIAIYSYEALTDQQWQELKKFIKENP